MKKHKDRPLRILLVDDMTTAGDQVQRGLRAIGVDIELRLAPPKDRTHPLGGCTLPEDEEWNAVDLALIDLELFNDERQAVEYVPADLFGGHQILPHIRAHAPWIPAVGYSRLFSEAGKYFMSVGCSFGFDGYMLREMMGGRWLHRDHWERLHSSARLVRKRALVGPGFEPSDELEIQISGYTRQQLDSSVRGWTAAVGGAFHFADRVALEPMAPGFSGASVLRALARLKGGVTGRDGQWVIKVSDNPWKLHREAECHARMIRSGLKFAQGVVMLWPDVVVENRVGVIAYQFAEGAVEAAKLMVSAGLEPVLQRVVPAIKELHRDSQPESIPLSEILKGEYKLPDLETAGQALDACPVSAFLAQLANQAGLPCLVTTVRHRRALIHGDLHLGNIMLGHEPVFIDFARSRHGPVSADVAKLLSDLLLRDLQLRRSFDWNWLLYPDSCSTPARALLEMAAEEGDRRLLRVLLICNLALSLGYDGVDVSAREGIKGLLEDLRDPPWPA